jgi:hypothetical protein
LSLFKARDMPIHFYEILPTSLDLIYQDFRVVNALLRMRGKIISVINQISGSFLSQERFVVHFKEV